MPRLLLLASIGCLFVVAGVQFGASQETRTRNGVDAKPFEKSASGSGGFIVGTPVRYKNLAIFPVLSKAELNSDRFITLDEGLRSHSVEVLEMGAGQSRLDRRIPAGQIGGDQRAVPQASIQSRPNAPSTDVQAAPPTRNPEPSGPFDDENVSSTNQVNRLLVVNRSGKPLYLMPGEVIVGGSQDRAIGEEMTVAPTGKPVPIDVFCVEHGRWGIRDVGPATRVLASLEPAASPAEEKERLEAVSKDKFVVTAGSLSKATRQAVQSGEGQQAVWDSVAKANRAVNMRSNSGAFTFNYSDPKVLKKLQPYLKSLNEAVAGQNRVVGGVVAINGKIESLDVFESTPLFRKLWPKLLKSHALDALSVSGQKGAAKRCDVAEATAFLSSTLEGAARETKTTKGGLIVTRREAKVGVCYSASAGAAKEGQGMGGGVGGSVHSAAYAH
jgi:ARG/rhodanese/phosphatase superfamily protein